MNATKSTDHYVQIPSNSGLILTNALIATFQGVWQLNKNQRNKNKPYSSGVEE